MSWRLAGVLVAAAVVLLALASRCSTLGPVAVRTPGGAGGAAGQTCMRLHDVLPEVVSGEGRRDTSPPSQLTAAWGAPPLVLRCAVPPPAASTPTSEVLEVEGVGWFLTERPRAYVFTTIGRSPNVELRVPAATPREQAANPLVDLAPAIRDAVPRDR